LGASKFKVGHVTLTTHFSGMICRFVLGLEIAYLCTKFDHSSFSCSRDGWYPPKFRWFMWPDHVPFRDGLPSIG